MTQIIDLGKLRFYFAGDYNPATVYELNDVVKYGGNSYVYTNVVSGAGHLPTDVTYWGLMVEGLNFLGDWSIGTAYKIGDAVAYGAVVYVAIQDGIGHEPDTSPSYWAKFTDSVTFAGAYSAGTTYQPNDIVSYGGSTYVAIQTTTGNVPTNTTYWSSFAGGVRYRGNWAPATAYLPNDLVFNGVSTYITTQAFTSASTFNADYTAGKWTYFATGAADILPPITGPAQYGESLTINNSGVIEWVNATNGVYVLYVSKAGNDSNPGTSLALPKLTIQGAVAAVPTNQKTAIFVKSGTYSELALPIVVPPYVAIIGDATRTTIVQPGPGNAADGITPNAESQMWALSDGSLLNKLTFQGMTGWVPGSVPADIGTSTPKGIFCGLNPASPIIVKSPYVIECSAFSTGGIGAYVNGSAHTNGNRSILFHEFTGIHDNGVGIWCDNNAKSECVGVFTYYCYFGYATTNGGQIRSISGNNSYGTYGSFSSGYSAAETPITGSLYGTLITLTGAYTGIINPGDTITDSVTGATATALNVQVSSIYVGPVTGGTFNPGDGITATSGGIGVVSSYGGQQGYTLVLNNLTAPPQVGQSIQIAGDTSSYIIQAVSGSWASSVSVLSVALAQQKVTASAAGSAVTLRSYFSLCRITAHDFLNVGTGGITTTNYPNTPTQAPNPANRVIQTLPGRIYYVSADEQGNFNVGAYFAVNQATGAATLNANSFNLSGLTSLRLGSIGAQLGAQINEFSTDGTMSQNSPVKVPTQSAVVTYVAAQTNTISGTNPILIQTGQAMSNTTYGVFSSQAAGTPSYSLGSSAPANLTINSSTGVLSQSGSNFTTGTYSVPISALVGGSTLVSKTVTITVNGQIPLFPSNTFPSATLIAPSSSFSNSSAAATALSGTVTYALVGGALPGWCTLNPTTGVISGTAPGTTASSATYNFVVTATNGSYSVSKAFTWTFVLGYPVGQSLFGTNVGTGTFSWTAPSGVTSVSVVAIGGGGGGSYSWSYGGGAGGGLGWKNNIPVVPGNTYTVVVGAGGPYVGSSNNSPSAVGGNSYFINTSTVCGFGAGQSGGTGGGYPSYSYTGGGGYTGDGGGAGGTTDTSWTSTGSGAGGYSNYGGSGNGAYGGYGGQGGGAGSGSYYSSTYGTGAGGGVGLNGQGNGNSGGSVAYQYIPFVGYYNSHSSYGGGGEGASGGQNGYYGENPFTGSGTQGGAYNCRGGTYGGGGGGSGTSWGGGPGAQGGVRIIWGPGRSFPSTLTADQPTVP